MQDNEDETAEINLTNLIINEVQLFIFTLRWMIYEFYDFRTLKKEGLLKRSDFDSLEDDVVYLMHRATVQDGVQETLLVLSRLLNNKIDKSLRRKYRLIAKN